MFETKTMVKHNHNQSPTPHQQSGKLSAKPLKGPSIKLSGFGDETDMQISYSDNQHMREKSTVHSSEILSTAQLISAVGQIWDCASRSLAGIQPKSGSNYLDTARRAGQNANDVCFLVENENLVALDVLASECLHVQSNSSRHSPSIVQKSLEFTRMTRKFCYTACEDFYVQNLFSGDCDDNSGMCNTWLREKSLEDVGITYGLLNRDRWHPMSTAIMSSSWETLNISRFFTREATVCCHLARKVGISSSNSGTNTFGECINTFNMSDQISNGGSISITNRNSPMSLLYSNYLLQVFQNAHHTTSNKANLHQSDADHLTEDGILQFEESNILGQIQIKSSSPVTNKPISPLLAKQEHAVSGALSGIVVSLCLHPVDTIKTVLQSCQAGQKSLYYIGQSIITERGLCGLYRGISSNITTSAPISAIYTFTYESVKGSLLPSLAKEYSSVAHCTAGACASIATSFIFTPSDHIKQQMQVNSKYQSCWNAALRIIEKGGLLSLYSGWGAVLCRNIPHSIIKFYTYESLKQIITSSELPNNQPSTLQTLLCGGLAGSAAALFSTPFDVVKTRLQTQMPGSAKKYQNILNALQQIRNHEGVKGLYRGLIPRLVMYMSQGALFFSSYEFFQSLPPLDLCHGSSEVLQHKQDSENDS